MKTGARGSDHVEETALCQQLGGKRRNRIGDVGGRPELPPRCDLQRIVSSGLAQLGDADWRANDGEITGAPKHESGGWLALNQGYQDLQFSTSFRCNGVCKTGILLRAEKTPDGMKGVFLSLNEGDVAAYEVVLDAQARRGQPR